MAAPANARGMEDDKSIIYNNMFAPTNCTGGTEQGCEPFAVTERERESARARGVLDDMNATNTSSVSSGSLVRERARERASER